MRRNSLTNNDIIVGMGDPLSKITLEPPQILNSKLYSPRDYNRTVFWEFEDIQMLLGKVGVQTFLTGRTVFLKPVFTVVRTGLLYRFQPVVQCILNRFSIGITLFIEAVLTCYKAVILASKIQPVFLNKFS